MILKKFIESKHDLAIVFGGRVIGSLGFHAYNEAALPFLSEIKAVEIGFALAKDRWGNGFMPEAVTAVTERLFSSLGYGAVVCGYYEGNERSKRVQEKCGFVPVKKLRTETRFGEKEEYLSVLYRVNSEE